MAKQQSFDLEPKKAGPVECLGMTFENDEARRAYFLERLKEKLQDPEFRTTPGFPKGTDEEILRISDPPYYTACPNPFLGQLISHRTVIPDGSIDYSREPFATDVSEGRYSPESLCHSYHTKIPARAIARYILHFTEPGHVILDGFGGSGMTGVAGHLARGGDPDFVSLLEPEWTARFGEKPKWGQRYVVLGDLSPAATFIEYNYTLPVDTRNFVEKAKLLVARLSDEIGWMYETRDVGGRTGAVNYTVWSDVFSCPSCGSEIVFYQAAVDLAGQEVMDNFSCQKCGVSLKKKDLERVWTSEYDHLHGQPMPRQKSIPVLINYSIGSKRFSKVPDESDIQLLEKVATNSGRFSIPFVKMLHREGVWGDQWRRGYHADVTHFHHYYTNRNAYALARFWELVVAEGLDTGVGMLLTATALKLSKLSRFMFDAAGRIQNGVLYIPSLHQEMSPLLLLDVAVGYIARYRDSICLDRSTWITTESTTGLQSIPDDSIDYVFTDPPFGDNLKYSELNFLWESWLGVYTKHEFEAVESKIQNKGLYEYQRLMTDCFRAYYRVLRPGRWITVVFHNSRNAVWNAIQESLQQAGFVVADVRGLEKKQGAFNQVVAAGAVKQDLVISAYKPDDSVSLQARLRPGSEQLVWEFVSSHLNHLPLISLENADEAQVVAERTSQLLFDRMIAFHVQRGISVPVSAGEFYQELDRKYAKLDGMYFLHDQVFEYDEKRAKVRAVKQLTFMINDEASAILWTRAELDRKPQSFQDLQPLFMREVQTWSGHERTVELKQILEENFLLYDGMVPVPAQIHTYLSTNFKDMRGLSKDDPILKAKAVDRWYVPDPNKQADLDQLRTKRLLKEFTEYNESKQKKLKQFRTEAVRAGFKAAYDQKDYRTIVDVAKKLPEQVIQEDEKLLMYYDVASMRLGED